MKRFLLTTTVISAMAIICLSTAFVISKANKQHTTEYTIHNVKYQITYPYRGVFYKKKCSNDLMIGSFPEIVYKLQPFSGDTLYTFQHSKKNRNCRIVPIYGHLEKKDLASFLQQKYLVRCDTMSCKGYLMNTDRFSTNPKSDGKMMLTTFSNLTLNLRSTTRELILWKGTKDSTIYISSKVLSIHSIEDLSEFLQKNYNIMLEDAADEPYCRISFHMD